MTKKYTPSSNARGPVAVIAMLASTSPPAFAQPATAPEAMVLEEVIVTAQKREERLQNVPLAVSVIAEGALEQAGIRSIDDLDTLVPSLQIVNTSRPGEFQGVARGVTNLVSNIQSTAVLGFYLDETPISSFGSVLPEVGLYDTQRVEFLRGPQGTLFGEGSMAGTLRFITNKPDPNAFEARGELTGSNTHGGGDGYSARALVNVPLVSDKLGLRVSGGYRSDDGWIDVPDLAIKDANGFEQTDARAALRWLVGERLTIDASYLHQHLQNDAETLETQPGTLSYQLSQPLAGPIRQLGASESDYDLGNLTLNLDFGAATLLSSTSYFLQEGQSLSDLSPVIPLFFGAILPGAQGVAEQTADNRSELSTEELRLVSNGDQRFDWTVGGFWRRLKREGDQAINVQLTAPIPLPLNLGDLSQSSETDSYALFAQGEYEMTARWSTALGVRYYKEDRDLVLTNNSAGGARTTSSGDDSEVSPSVALTFQANDHTTLFARAASGFRAGGSNSAVGLVSVPLNYDPETLLSYEVGAKLSPHSSINFNAYGFYNDWHDLQLARIAIGPGGVQLGYTGNAGTARAYGVEIESVARPFPELTLSAALSYTESEITEDVSDNGILVVHDGDPIPYVPKVTANFGIAYAHPLSATLSLLTRLDYSHRDGTSSELTDSAALRNPSLDLVNARVGLQIGRFEVSAFAENLLDEDASSSRSASAVPGVTFFVPTRPKTIGLTLRANF